MNTILVIQSILLEIDLITYLVYLLVVLVVIIAVRPIVLWYYKIDVQADLLNEQKDLLKEILQRLNKSEVDDLETPTKDDVSVTKDDESVNDPEVLNDLINRLKKND
jgi:hypothetical protein